MKPFVIVAKLAVTAILITLVTRAFDLHGVGGYLAQIDATTAVSVIAVALGVVPLQTWRWMIALDESGSRLPFGRTLVIVLIGHFFNQTLPSSVGGDAVRIWCAYRAGLTPANAAATVILDRAISLVGLLALTACGLPWLLALVPDPVARSAIVVVVVAGIGGFLAFIGLARFPEFLQQWRIARGLTALAALGRRLTFSPQRLLPSLALSAAGIVVFSYMVFQLAQALGVRLSFIESLLLVPPVLLVTVIPVSVAGWGLREGAMVVALGFVGVAPAAAFAISVLFGIAVAAASLPGAVLWLASGYSVGNLQQAADLAASARREQAAALDDAPPTTPPR